MATWYARQTNVNINATNVWNSAADGSGSWLTWPPAENDILVANGNTLRFNVNTSVAELQNDTRSGATLGGGFQLNTAGVAVAANGYNSSGNSVGIVRVTLASGVVSYVGNIYGGSVLNSPGILLGSGIGPTLNLTGNIYTFGGNQAYGITIQPTFSGALNITGDVYGSDTGRSFGIFQQSPAAVTIRNAFGGNASFSPAVLAATGSNVTVTGYAQASDASSAIDNPSSIVTVGETRSAPNGRNAITGAFRYTANGANCPKLRVDGRNVKYLEFDGTDFLTLTANQSLGATSVVYVAASTGITRLDNVSVGTRHQMPGTPLSGTANIYGYLVLPAMPSNAEDARIQAYLRSKAGL